MQLDSYISAEGPFDAILGFSGGAVLAATYLRSRYCHSGPGLCNGKVPLRCSIFLSCASFNPKGICRGKKSPLDAELIKIPTLHVWGSKDVIAPNGGRDVSNIRDPAQQHILVHDGGHEIPLQGYLVELLHAIRRILAVAGDGGGGKIISVVRE